MITAMQGARLKAAVTLHDTRNALLDIHSLICWTPEQAREIAKIVENVDALFNTIQPK